MLQSWLTAAANSLDGSSGNVAGIIGHIGPGDSNRFRQSASLMRHDRRFAVRCYRDDPRLKLAAVSREDSPAYDTYVDRLGIGVIVYGSPMLPSSSTVAAAGDIHDAYRAGGEASLTTYDGGFVIVVLDEPRGVVIIVNDRMATHTVAYIAQGGRFVFAPEAKAALLTAGLDPRLDPNGCLEFLSIGVPVADHTLFGGVRILRPAHVVRVALRDGSFLLSPYWDLEFREDLTLRNERVAVTALFDVLSTNVRRAAQAASGGYDLLLTGGYDSRTILALAEVAGRMPQRAIGWGVSESIPVSDPYIARRLATQFKVPFEFTGYDHDTFAEQAEPWAFVSEIGSDNLGNFAAGPQGLVSVGNLAPAVFNGDQLLGSGGIPVSFADAFEVGTGLPFHGMTPGMATMLARTRAREAAEIARDGLMQMALARRDMPSKDVQDYLGWQTHGLRWLNAPMYHREPMVSPWRPLAYGSAVELFERLPASYRVDKRLLVRMLERCVPHALSEPIASANSLVDWRIAFGTRTAAGMFFESVADEALFLESEVGAFFDPDAVRDVFKAFSCADHVPISRRPSFETGIEAVRRLFARWHASSVAVRRAQRLVTRLRGRSVGAGDTRVLWRIVLLNLLLRTIERGWFRDGAPWQTVALSHSEQRLVWPPARTDEGVRGPSENG